MWTITYRGFLQTITRKFPSKESGELWLRQIGRSDLIPKLKTPA